MGNAINLECRALWLMLCRDGGWWTVNSLVRHWHPTFTDFEVAEMLQALENGHFVECRAQFTQGLTYCVTSDCASLPGINRPAIRPLFPHVSPQNQTRNHPRSTHATPEPNPQPPQEYPCLIHPALTSTNSKC
jgi:hypothetical protein